MINSKWFNGFKGTPEERKKREESIRAGQYVLTILTEILERELKEVSISKVQDYDNPSWAYLQADKNGADRTLRNILKLTRLEGESE